MPVDAVVQGQEFWNAAGFVGTFARDYHDDLEEGEEEGDSEEDGWSFPGDTAELQLASGGKDDEPVFEICEPLDGGEARLITHASQKAFEEAQRLGADSRMP